MNYTINAIYFSPTGTTKKVVSSISEMILEKMSMENKVKYIDFTKPETRIHSLSFGKTDILVVGVPVYAGRVPNVLLKYLNLISSSGALAIPVVVYGNRNYDDALIELKDILESNGFNIIAAAAFIGEHSFSYTLAKGRPDEKDMNIINKFSDGIKFVLTNKLSAEKIVVPGRIAGREYYMPRDNDGNPVDIRKITPKINEKCNNCKLCVDVCPMGSIDIKDVSKLNGICIKCGSCIKKCPMQAKFFDNPAYLQHKKELEINFAIRREPELFYHNLFFSKGNKGNL